MLFMFFFFSLVGSPVAEQQRSMGLRGAPLACQRLPRGELERDRKGELLTAPAGSEKQIQPGLCDLQR